MPREWTEDQRAEASQQAKKRWAKQGGQRASVTVAPSAEQMLISQAQATPPQVTTQDLRDVMDKETVGDDRGVVSHTKPSKVRVYKPTPYGYKAREIPVTNLAQALEGGFLPHCPDCNEAGIPGADCGDGPNDCPNREKRMYRVCPVPQCGKKIHDYLQDIEVTDEDDEMKIVDDSYMQSTPELRTKSVMDKHMLVLHPNEAAAAGIVAPMQRERSVAGGSTV